MKTRRLLHNQIGRCLPGIASLLMVVGNASGSYESTVLNDHPVAYYPLNLDVDNASAGTGSVATDLSGNGLAGDAVNISLDLGNKVPGPSQFITNAIRFDGASTWITLPASDLLNFGGQISLEAWVQPAGNNNSFQNIVAKGYDQNYNETELRQVGSVYQTAGGAVSAPATPGAWAHVVATHDGTSWNIYVNGALIQSSASSSGAANFGDQWSIGDGTDKGHGRYFTGNLCQVAIYNFGLTPDQVKMHYWTGKFGTTNFPPNITVQPSASSRVFAGASYKLGVTVDSALPDVRYQWLKGNSPLDKQTNSTFALANVQLSDAGTYTVTISNAVGVVTSSAAVLEVVKPGPYEAGVVADKPIAFYPLNEVSGDAVLDYVNGFNGVYKSSPSLGEAGPSKYIPSGVRFSGDTGQIADLGNRPEMNISGAVSMEAWVQAGVNDNGYIVAHGLNLSPTIETELKATSAGFAIEEYGVYYKGATAPYQSGDIAGNWVHLVGTWDGANWNIYRNGVLAASTPSPGGLVAVKDCPWAIGGSGTTGWGGRNFAGVVSEVAIYDHALTVAQVMAHYHLGVLGTTNPPPTLTADLTPRTVYVGGTLHLTAGFDSALPLTYTWYKGITALTGQTNASLILTNMRASDAGSYKVTASSQAGTKTSSAATVAVTTPGLYGAAVMGDKPFAYYPLDETSGATAVDYGGAFDGIYENSVALGVGGPSTFIGSAPIFSAASRQYVDLASYTDSMNFGGPLAMEAWVYPTSVGASGIQNIIAKGWVQDPVYSEIVLRENSDGYLGGDVNASIGGVAVAAEWTHLVCSYDGTNWMLFKNGVLVGMVDDARGIAPFRAPWAIGSGTVRGADRYFDGAICQVAIYNHGLTPDQVAGHYQIGTLGVYLPPSITADLPANATVYAGGEVHVTVGVSSAIPATYTWYKGATVLADQTNATLLIRNAKTSDAGVYHVRVSNQAGEISSATMTLAVVASRLYGNVILADSPLAYYPLDEVAGSTAVDYAGHGFSGTYVNEPQIGTAGPSKIIPAAVNFDGSSQKVVIDSYPELNFSGKITMEAWVKPVASTTWGDILAKGYSSANNYAEVMLRANNGNYYAAGNGDVGGGTETTDWTYVVASNDGTNWNMYVNGVPVASRGYPGGSRNLPYPWAIASGSIDGASRYFAGSVCQVALYNYALSPEKVLGHYQIGVLGSNLPPAIVSAPSASVTSYAGNDVYVTVSVSSSLPVSYIWYKGESVIAGQTNATLVLGNVQTGDAGGYHVIITSQAGSTTSADTVLTVAAAGPYGKAIMADKPLVYYPLDETDGTTAVDYAGHGFSGVYRNSPQLGAAGPSSGLRAVTFDGTSQKVDIDAHPELNFSGTITMEAWVKPASTTTWGDILAKGYDGGNNYAELVLRANNGNYYAAGDGDVGGGTETTDWTHVVCNNDGTNWNMYINGVLVASKAGSGGARNLPYPWAIASGSIDGAGRYFAGSVCQVALYDHALAADQILAHFVAGQNGGVTPKAILTSVKVSGGNLILSGTNGVANGSYTVVCSANLAIPMSEWTPVVTNKFDANGSFVSTNVIEAGTVERFYGIKY